MESILEKFANVVVEDSMKDFKLSETTSKSDSVPEKSETMINNLCTEPRLPSQQPTIFHSFMNQTSQKPAIQPSTEFTQPSKEFQQSIKRRNSLTLYMGTKSSETRKNEIISSKADDNNHASSVPMANHQHIPLKPTIPISPKFRSASRQKERGGEKQLTSEELELLKIEQEKLEHKERLEKIKKLFEVNKVRTGAASAHIRSTKEATIPVTPINHLNKRLGRKEHQHTNDENHPLRSNHTHHAAVTAASEGEHAGPRKPTIPQPFHFASYVRAASANRTRKESSTTITDSSAPATTVSEKFHNFLKDARNIHVSENACKKLTIGQAPVFETDKRSKSRPKTHVKSLEEQEIEFMAKMKSMQFKAKPAPTFEHVSIASSSVPSTARVEGDETTTASASEKHHHTIEFKPFHFKTDERIEQRKSLQQSAVNGPNTPSSSYVFKARPMPDFSHPDLEISNSPTHKLSVQPVTKPISPKLSGGARASSAPPIRQKPHHSIMEQQRQMAKNFVPKKVSLTITEPKGFHLQSDERGQIYQSILNEKLKQEQKVLIQQRNYQAQPVPTTIFRKPLVIKTSSKELTEFQEFQLKSIQRHQTAEDNKSKQLEFEKSVDIKSKEFHAKPVPKSTYESKDLNPKIHSEKELIQPMAIQFESDKRMEARKSFDLKMKEKILELEIQQKKLEEMKIQDENQKINELRSKPIEQGGMKFIAKPVLKEDLYPTKYVPVIPLTEPKSPLLKTAQRAEMYTTHINSVQLQNQLDLM